MNENEKNEICTRNCWKMAAAGGLVLALLLWILTGLGFIQALFAGIVVGVIGGFVLTSMYCAKAGADTSASASQPKAAPAAASTGAAPAVASAAPAAAAASTTATVAKPTAQTPAQDGPSASTDGAAAETAKPAKAAGKPTAKAAKPAAKTAAKAAKPAAKVAKPAAKAEAPAAKAAAKPKRAPVAPDGKPELLTAARSGGADDLKLISGVGPKLEGMLNTMGVWHFDQVASWRKKEVQWVNDNLEGFKGRIERDDWVSQAKTLAKGGQTEFSARKKK